MRIDRRTLLIVALVAGALWGWQQLSYATDEVAVLRTWGDGYVEHYASVWFVHANHALWIRAEDREQPWLAEIRENPRVELAIGGQTRAYEANPIDVLKYQSYIDAEFRKKYGVMDWLRALEGNRDTLPIRLEPI